MVTKSVEFYFDYGSPAAWLAYTQLPKLAADTGATVVLKPILSLPPPYQQSRRGLNC